MVIYTCGLYRPVLPDTGQYYIVQLDNCLVGASVSTALYRSVLLGTCSYCVVQCSTGIYYIVLAFVVWYWPVLCGTGLYYVVQACNVWYWPVLHVTYRSVQRCTGQYYVVLTSIALKKYCVSIYADVDCSSLQYYVVTCHSLQYFAVFAVVCLELY